MNELFYDSGRRARIKRALSSVVHSVYLDVERDHSKSVFLCGTGRSGTTWLADLINHANEYRYLYEPFTREHVPFCRHFSIRQYIRPDADGGPFYNTAKAVFCGRVRDPWIDHYNRRAFPRQRLVKDVRSNLMLKWIRNRFPSMPMVLLVRHPCAVAVSKVKLQWGIDIPAFLRQPDLMADHLTPYAELIASASTPFEKHVTAWCIETLVPLTQLERGDVHLVFYEHLCVDPEAELRRLFAHLRKPFDPALLKRLGRPSATARTSGTASPVVSGRNDIDDWRRHITAADLASARRITGRFGLDDLYGNGSLPDARCAESVFKRLGDVHRAS